MGVVGGWSGLLRYCRYRVWPQRRRRHATSTCVIASVSTAAAVLPSTVATALSTHMTIGLDVVGTDLSLLGSTMLPLVRDVPRSMPQACAKDLRGRHQRPQVDPCLLLTKGWRLLLLLESAP